jgi:4a-hydroxytetrahydrobiopterin dehydratase
MSLAEKKCLACSGDMPRLTEEEQKKLIKELDDWKVDREGHLSKAFKLDDFQAAITLANRVGEIAETEGHHPDLLVRWGELGVTIWTHAVNGLTESDFILAAKIDALVKSRAKAAT